MEAFVKWLLTAQGISVGGVVLAFAALLLFGLHKRWWVPGWVYTDVVKNRDELAESQRLRTVEDRQKAEELVSETERLRSEVESLKIALIKRQERRAKRNPE